MHKKPKKRKWKKISERQKDKIIKRYECGITTGEILQMHKITREQFYRIIKNERSQNDT